MAQTVIEYKAAIVALWLLLFLGAERLLPATTRPDDERRVGRNAGLWLVNTVMSVMIILPLSAEAAQLGPDWRPAWWSGAGGLILDLRLGALVSDLRTWRDLRLRLGVKDGQVALKTLRVKDVVGVDVRVRGDIDLNQTAPLLSLDFVGGSARLDRLAGYLGESWRRPLRQIGAARVRGRITGAAAAATLETALEGIGGLAKLTAP
ncbi:MAG: hypothetical protein QGF33_10830, partial [Alphaproteobacteria bacterium]|nr:hypothetical protein [Alphaproteobacteria bacterium]